MSAQYDKRFSPPPYLVHGPRAPGRPRKPEDEVLHVYTLRLTEVEHAKLKKLGGRVWVQKQLARTKA
jgi:hypothetical protein